MQNKNKQNKTKFESIVFIQSYIDNILSRGFVRTKDPTHCFFAEPDSEVSLSTLSECCFDHMTACRVLFRPAYSDLPSLCWKSEVSGRSPSAIGYPFCPSLCHLFC